MKIKLLLLCTAFTVLCSCNSARVNVEYNPEVDFFKFKTYQWFAAKDTNTKDYTSLKEQKISSVIRETLAEKGLHMAKTADVLVAVNLIEKEKVHYSRVRTGIHYPYYWGYHGYWDYEPDYYTESTLIVAIVDPKSKKALWEGSVTDWNFDRISDEEMTKLIGELLKHYPPVLSDAYSEVH